MELKLENNNAIYEEKNRIEKLTNKEAENRILKNKFVYKFVKRIIDIIAGLIGIILLLPLTIILYIVKLFSKEHKGPLFYEQLRIGKNGKTFRIFKYRTMIVGADEILERYLEENEEAKEEFEANQKLDNDPRITKFGNFLRKTSLDEFPQFINVLRGDMSLIGPRPLVKGELDLHNGNHKIYESVRPGITGWWGCNGRSATNYEERLQLEYYYVENMSIWLDIKCIFKTIGSILKKEGAK